MKQPVGYYCSKCKTMHLSAGNWTSASKEKRAKETKLYAAHRKYGGKPV